MNDIYDAFSAPPAAGEIDTLLDRTVPLLVEHWCENYSSSSGEADISEISLANFTYLFDHTAERLVAAFGITMPAPTMSRDRARQRGHPLAEPDRDDRGHAIPNSAGGRLDINLFPQRSKLNRGAFRRLEKLAVRHPGSFYFVRFRYGDEGQRPNEIEQGVLVNDPAGSRFEMEVFCN